MVILLLLNQSLESVFDIIINHYDYNMIMQKLFKISYSIYSDLKAENRKLYKRYAQQLTDLLPVCKDIYQARCIFAAAFYNLGKLSNRYRYVQTCLQFVEDELVKVKYWLQMLAFASSRGSHVEAHEEACKLIQHILALIHQLKLESGVSMFAREVIQLIHRAKSSNIISANALNELEMSRKFQTDCPYVSKTFHIADIMIMAPINPEGKKPKPNMLEQQKFFHLLVYLSIACFTRATERFYCRDSSDRDFHFKAIQIASYLYSSKSTYMRFLRRTYREHYLEHLDEIEQVCEYGDIKVPVQVDPEEVSLMKMPWQQQEYQVEQQLVNQSLLEKVKMEEKSEGAESKTEEKEGQQ